MICLPIDCTLPLVCTDIVVRKVSLSDEGSQYLVKTASITVYDIPSVEQPRASLGSVSFGESFIDSALAVEKRGAHPPSTDVTCVILRTCSCCV